MMLCSIIFYNDSRAIFILWLLALYFIISTIALSLTQWLKKIRFRFFIIPPCNNRCNISEYHSSEKLSLCRILKNDQIYGGFCPVSVRHLLYPLYCPSAFVGCFLHARKARERSVRW